MGNDVTIKLRGDKSDLDNALASSQSSVMNWGNAVKGALVGIGTALAVKQLYDFGSNMVEMYREAVEAETRLNSVIRATGGAAGFTTEQLVGLSSVLQNQIGIGDDVIQNAMAIIATFKNIKGDTFKEATVLAADMAQVLGGDLNSAAMQVAKALNDPTKGITALSRAGVSFTQTQKDMIEKLQEGGDMMSAQRIILDELASEFGGAASDNVKTFYGSTTLLWNRLGDVGEVIGESVINALGGLYPVFELVVVSIENLANMLSIGEETAKEFSDTFGTYLASGLKYAVSAAADAFSVLEFTFTNFSLIAERQAQAWIMSFVSFSEEVKHLTTTVVPEYLKWLGENWANVLYDISNFQQTVLQNMGNNLVEFFAGLADYLQGGSGSFEFVALTEGFELTMKKLPEIAAREQSAMEQYLRQSINVIDKQLGESFDRTFTKNRNFVDKLFAQGKQQEIDLTANFVPFEAATQAAVAKVAKAAKDVKDDRNAIEQSNNEAKTAGTTAAITGLNSTIQENAIKNSLGQIFQGVPAFFQQMFRAPGMQQFQFTQNNAGQRVLTQREQDAAEARERRKQAREEAIERSKEERAAREKLKADLQAQADAKNKPTQGQLDAMNRAADALSNLNLDLGLPKKTAQDLSKEKSAIESLLNLNTKIPLPLKTLPVTAPDSGMPPAPPKQMKVASPDDGMPPVPFKTIPVTAPDLGEPPVPITVPIGPTQSPMFDWFDAFQSAAEILAPPLSVGSSLWDQVSVNTDAPATVGQLTEIKDVLKTQHPEMIRALQSSGGLV